MDDGGWFSQKQTIFWAGIAGLFTSYYKYKTALIMKQKETGIMENGTTKLGDENIKLALGDVNAIGCEIAKVAKDGIQAKDAATVVEDIMTSPELRAHITNFVNHAKAAIPEVKDIDVLEGIDVVKFEYDGVKNIIEILKS